MPLSPALNRIRTRAMHRASAKLRDLHRDEYETLFAAEMQTATAEAAEHTAKSHIEHPGEGPRQRPSGSGPRFQPQPPIPPSLIPGVRPTGEPRVREDVARCPYCARYHDRGHECASCRSRPPSAPPRDPYARPPESVLGTAAGLAAG